MTKPKVHFIFIRNIDFYCIFKDFHEMLDYLTFVSLRSHFVETNLISLTLFQFADFVCKIKEPLLRLFYFCIYSSVPTFAASKSSSISALGFFVRSETATIQMHEKMNAGSSS